MPCTITRYYDDYKPSLFHQEERDVFQVAGDRIHLDFENYYGKGIQIDDGYTEFALGHWIGYS